MASKTAHTMSPSPSSFEDTTENVTEWMRVHGVKVAAAAGAVIVALAVAWFVRSNSERKESRAGLALGQAQQAVFQGDATSAQRQLQEVAQRYAGTAPGTEAQLQLAQLYYDQGKFQDGLNVLAQANGAPKSLKGAVKQLTAVGYEGLNKFVDAAKAYEEVATGAPTEAERLQLRASAARAYQAGNDKAAALKIWQELAQTDSRGIADEARVRVGELTATPAR
jgi:predicted negative regulator of RcsB-dependent stress response